MEGRKEKRGRETEKEVGRKEDISFIKQVLNLPSKGE